MAEQWSWRDWGGRRRGLRDVAASSLRGATRRSNPSVLCAARWIASRSLSSGAHSRDPLARNDGIDTTPHSRDAKCARAVAKTLSLERKEGAGKAGCPMHPQPRVQSKKAHEQITTGSPETSRPSLRNGLRLIRALSGERALLPPSPALLIADLTPASRSQGHTISPSASSVARLASPKRPLHPAPR